MTTRKNLAPKHFVLWEFRIYCGNATLLFGLLEAQIGQLQRLPSPASAWLNSHMSSPPPESISACVHTCTIARVKVCSFEGTRPNTRLGGLTQPVERSAGPWFHNLLFSRFYQGANVHICTPEQLQRWNPSWPVIILAGVHNCTSAHLNYCTRDAPRPGNISFHRHTCTCAHLHYCTFE
jgi:hypothetical protein